MTQIEGMQQQIQALQQQIEAQQIEAVEFRYRVRVVEARIAATASIVDKQQTQQQGRSLSDDEQAARAAKVRLPAFAMAELCR